ncbi:MAG: DUF1573 domain-containing protein [Crocinitomicaceae bacterium]|jgi:hypothetical protein|tara:strand:+ start:36321 stop:37163 length:843 start_codon:yes stop_codon:yes gene_type:complete
MKISILGLFTLTLTLIMSSCGSDLPLDVVIKEVPEVNYKEQGEDFLKKNATRAGVTTTSSGLQYEIVTPSEGPKPNATTKVSVHYHGTTPEGDVFDSSVDRDMPSEFKLNQVIRGWTEGLQLMSVGSKYRFYIPQELAYGASGKSGTVIKPFMPLVFEVELLAILDEEEPVETAPLTSLKFDKEQHDFGKIKEDTDNKTVFRVTNTGKSPLIIKDVKASCGCTTPSKPTKPIAPGKSDKIEVVFHPKVGQLNKQSKTIRVTANTEPKETVLTISAVVEKK